MVVVLLIDADVSIIPQCCLVISRMTTSVRGTVPRSLPDTWRHYSPCPSYQKTHYHGGLGAVDLCTGRSTDCRPHAGMQVLSHPQPRSDCWVAQNYSVIIASPPPARLAWYRCRYTRPACSFPHASQRHRLLPSTTSFLSDTWTEHGATWGGYR